MTSSPRTALRPIHVGIVTQWYRPENVPIPSDLGDHLVAQGHRVTVLTGFPNYPAGVVYPGFRQRWTSREVVDGIRVVRSPIYASHDSHPIRRALTYVSFAVSTVLHAHQLRTCDVVYVYSSPITATLAPIVCKLLWRIPIVAHVQDLWPESVTQSGMVRKGRRGIALRIFHDVCDRIYNSSSALVTIAPSMKRMLMNRGIPQEKITSIYNWSPVAAPHLAAHDQDSARSGPRTVLYAGNLGAAQDLIAVADAVQTCGPDLPLQIRMVGGGVLAEVLRERAVDIPQLTVDAPVDVSEMGSLYQSCDFSLVTLRDAPLFEGTIPSKFQASLAHGLPVITSVKGDVAAIVEAYGCGIFADPSVEGSMEAALRQASTTSDEDLAAMREGCRRASRELFDKGLCLDELSALLTFTANTSTKNGQ